MGLPLATDYEKTVNKFSNLSLASNIILFWDTSRISNIIDDLNLREQGKKRQLLSFTNNIYLRVYSLHLDRENNQGCVKNC